MLRQKKADKEAGLARKVRLNHAVLLIQVRVLAVVVSGRSQWAKAA